jgi:programmed cell death 6-interacting protein
MIRSQNLASTDDISDRVKLEAIGLERWTQVKAEMFEDVMGEELDKYEDYRKEISGSKDAQEELLQKIEVRCSSTNEISP